MAKQPTVLIIDDDNDWLGLFGEALRSHFHVEEASTVAETQTIISNKGGDIQIALVDLRLKEDEKMKQSGLDAMFLLKKRGIPCIVVTAYEAGKTIRDAFVVGHASDVWFKTEDFVTLRKKIDDVLKSDVSREETVIYKNRLILATALNATLLIVLIFTLPYAVEWGWLIAHPKRLGLQISFLLIALGILWAAFDTDEKRRLFAIGSVVIAALLALIQII